MQQAHGEHGQRRRMVKSGQGDGNVCDPEKKRSGGELTRIAVDGWIVHVNNYWAVSPRSCNV